MIGLEAYHLLRPLVRPEAFPYARFTVTGVEHIPASGPVLLVSNHRSYFDVAALALVAARLGRPVRFMGKQELFDAPVVGHLARALGGIPVDRGSGSGDPMRQAAAALRAGEVVLVLPQGTIPRGETFFDPVLHGHTGAARLAAETGAPVIPIALWGTEAVWPRSSKGPQRGQPPASPQGDRHRRSAGDPRSRPTRWPTRPRSCRPSPTCCRTRPGCHGSRRTRN